jgi:hypothetical protein
MVLVIFRVIVLLLNCVIRGRVFVDIFVTTTVTVTTLPIPGRSEGVIPFKGQVSSVYWAKEGCWPPAAELENRKARELDLEVQKEDRLQTHAWTCKSLHWSPIDSGWGHSLG